MSEQRFDVLEKKGGIKVPFLGEGAKKSAFNLAAILVNEQGEHPSNVRILHFENEKLIAIYDFCGERVLS